jgi:DNA end-binding protein Ku
MARGIWKGTLGFGLVSIGVELFSAESPERIDLDLLDRRDHSRIRYKKVNESTGEEVEQKDIVKGYAVEKDEYVILSDEDLKAANPKASQTVDVLGFVGAAEIPPIYYAKPYYLAPTKGSERAFALFREALEKSEQIAVAQIVIRTRQYVAAVYPHDAVLVVHLLRYHDELREPKEAGAEAAERAAKREVRPQELKMAEQLMSAMELKWDPTEYTDTYRNDVLKLVDDLAEGKKIKKTPAAKQADGKVIDLMAALKKSVAAQGKSTGRTRRATTRTKAAARKKAG